MELNELRRYLYNHKGKDGKKDLVIRIRETGDSIYYKGIEAFEIKNDCIEVVDNIYQLNNAFIKSHKEELENSQERQKILNTYVDMRNKLINLKLLKIQEQPTIEFEKGDGESYKDRIAEVNDNKEKIIKNIQIQLKNNNYKKDVELDQDNGDGKYKLKINTNCLELIDIEYIVMNAFVNFNEAEWKEPKKRYLNQNVSGWKKPTNKVTEVIRKNIKEVDKECLEKILDTIKECIDEYLKISPENERNYQSQFMLSDDTKKKLIYEIKKANGNNISYNDITVNDYEYLYPFEKEYFILNTDGRIDCIFFDIKENENADVYLIELKVNENVLGGNNGVHKHLSDIDKLLKKDKETLKRDLKTYMNYRCDALDEQNKKIEEINNIHFWTIIGVTDEIHKEICKQLLDIYFKNDSESKKFEPLKDYMKNLKESECDVRFFFDDFNDYKITPNELEEYKFEN